MVDSDATALPADMQTKRRNTSVQHDKNRTVKGVYCEVDPENSGAKIGDRPIEEEHPSDGVHYRAHQTPKVQTSKGFVVHRITLRSCACLATHQDEDDPNGNECRRPLVYQRRVDQDDRPADEGDTPHLFDGHAFTSWVNGR